MGARVVPVVNPQVRYEHLGGDASRLKAYKQYLLFGLVVTLVVVLVLVTAYHGWEEFSRAQKKLKGDDVDFMMYGPLRTELGVGVIQERRANLYARAYYNRDDFVLKYSSSGNYMADEELPSFPDHKTPPTAGGFKMVCYYALPTNSSVLTFGSLKASDLDPHLCTHINLAFASISKNRVVPTSVFDTRSYYQVNRLKLTNPHLKILLSVNGDLSQMIQEHASRKTFIKSVMDLLQKYNLDGLDIDWEFPDDKWKFMILLAEFRQEFGDRFLLTAAVAAPQVIAETAYKINVMARYVDWVNVMTYDFHFYSRFSPWTGLNSPLFVNWADKGYFGELNTNWTAHYYLEKGMPRDKIVLGIPTYGHTFKLVNKGNTGLFSPASSFGGYGGSSGGFIDYWDVCNFLTEEEATQVFDRSSRSPYAYKDDLWMSYEDERSVAYKTEYVVQKGFGGVMIWSLNSDDHRGLCYQSGFRFPLTSRIKTVLTDDML